MLLEFDLSGAEWVVVAYLSGDPNMLRVVEGGLQPHVETGKLISRAPEELILQEHSLLGSTTDPDEILQVRRTNIPDLLDGDYFLPRTMTIRQAGKKGNHSLNYDSRYRGFALTNEMPEPDAKVIVNAYRNDAYPGLVTWHESIRQELRDNNRTLTNLLGNKVRLLDQSGPDLWKAAYSYKPQSTVGDIVRRAMVLMYEDNDSVGRLAKPKANVHDSILVNYPVDPLDRLLEFVNRTVGYMSPELHCNGRTFKLGVDVKMGHNWGTMEKFDAHRHVRVGVPQTSPS
jgi:hypothetical protein